MATPVIQSYCHIKDNRVFRNGELFLEEKASASMGSFLKKIYNSLNLKYPKFYKMDKISKLGFLAAELVLEKHPNVKFDPSETGVVLSNSQSTLVTDTAHQQTINHAENYFPSPSIFVYTLPNIMIGEISIHHKLRGENAFFIFEHFNAEFVSEYINLLFGHEKIKACLGGWVDQSENQYEAFLYYAELADEQVKFMEHNDKQVKQLYEIIEQNGRTD